MLVGGFEVDVRREAQFRALLEHGGMGNAGVEPDVERVVAPGGPFGQPDGLRPPCVVLFKPEVGAVRFHQIGDFADDGGVQDRLALGAVEHRERHAPAALARDAPVGPRFHGPVDAVAAPVRNPVDGVDLGERLFAQRIDADEELFERPEDHRRFGAPAMGIRVGVALLAQERTAGAQEFDHLGVDVENVFTFPCGHPDLFGKATAFVHGRKNGQAVFDACKVVVRAVARCDVDLAGAGFERDKIGEDDGRNAVQERVARLGPFQFRAGKLLRLALDGLPAGFRAELLDEPLGDDEHFAAPALRVLERLGHVFETRVNGDGHVGGKRPRRGGPDNHVGLACERPGGDGELDEDRGIGAVGVFDFRLGESGLRPGAPVDRLHALVDQAFFHERAERADDLAFVFGGERKVRVIPIAQNAQTPELTALDVDEFAGVSLGFLADFQGRESAGFLDDLEFDGQPVAVPAGDERGAVAEHRLGFDDQVLQNFVERGAHVDVAIGEGRAVVEHEERGVFAGRLNLSVERLAFPLGQPCGLAGNEVGLHGEVRFGEIQRVFVVRAHRIGRDSLSAP